MGNSLFEGNPVSVRECKQANGILIDSLKFIPLLNSPRVAEKNLAALSLFFRVNYQHNSGNKGNF